MNYGQHLIDKIKDDTIQKDIPHEYGAVDFRGGYEQLYAYKFSIYLGCVSRYIQNKQLRDLPYTVE